MAEHLTTRQIAEASGRSTDTVTRAIKKFFPECVHDRATTYLTRDQAQVVMLAIRVRPERLAEMAARCRTDAADCTVSTAVATRQGEATR